MVGDIIDRIIPQRNSPPATNPATFDTRNGHLVLDFDTTTQEIAIFKVFMPQTYGGNGITCYVTWAASTATTGTGGWDVTLERIGDGLQDIDADGFGTAQTITAATVPGTSGNTTTTSVTMADGTGMDSVAAGEWFRLRLRRDVANDTAAGDLELFGIVIREGTSL